MTRSSWGLDTDRDLNWRQFAACGPDNAEWFFIVGTGGHLSSLNKAALEICRSCPVTSECLADARSVRTPENRRIAGGEIVGDRPSRAKEPRVAGVSVRGSGHTARHDRRWKS